jgi:ADP-heptose:LPS heptosyltransferase
MVKFLVIRFSSIGDIVLTTPVVRGLSQQVENAEVHYLTKPDFAPLLSVNPYITKVHILAENPAETIGQLKQEGYDYVIDLQHNLRSLNIKRALKRMFFTVHKLNRKKWLLVNLRINRLPDLHIVDRYLHTVQLFSVENDGKGLDYFIPEGEHVADTDLPAPFRSGYIALVIGAKHVTKQLPPEKMAALITGLNHPVILVGGPEDKENGEWLVASLPQKKILNGCGRWTVNQSASVIQQANCVITHDTGMMHIAAAFNKKIITIWGNTVPQFGMYAYQPDPSSIDFEVDGLTCRPCSKLGKSSCPKTHFKCMVDQDTGEIAAAANRLF